MEKSEDSDEEKLNQVGSGMDVQYVNQLIGESDLLVTEEESGLFPVVGKIKPPLIKENSSTGAVYLTELNENLVVMAEMSTMLEDVEELALEKTKTMANLMQSPFHDDGRGLTEVEEAKQESDSEDKSDLESEREDSIFDHEDMWDTDLEQGTTDDFGIHKDHSQPAKYLDHCERLDVVPAKYFLANMHRPVLAMRHHGLGPLGTKTLSKSLESNISVDKLDLSENGMQSAGAHAVARMLEENNFITKLIIADNMIGDQGVLYLSKAMNTNQGLKYMDLSGNSITDNGCTDISDLINKSKNLTSLILSHNDIGSKGGCILRASIGSNDILESLDLSWNKIRGEGAAELARGLKENIRIKHCNLSFNGFAREGGLAIAEAVRDNSVLTSLNLEANRLDEEVVVLIGRALTANESLEELAIGFNPINTTGILSLLSSVNSYEMSALKKLSLKDIPVDFEAVKLAQQMQLTRRGEFECEHGLEIAVGNTELDKTRRMTNPRHPIMLLRDHVLINDLRLVDILRRIDEAGNLFVDVEQFGQALAELGVPFKKSQLLDLRARLDKLGNGTIYYGDFIPKSEEKITELESENNIPEVEIANQN